MNGPHVTQAPTLANPMAFHTVNELRQALHGANGVLLDLSVRLHEMSQVAHETAGSIAMLIRARRQWGDQAALKLLTVLEESLLNPDATAKTAPGNLH